MELEETEREMEESLSLLGREAPEELVKEWKEKREIIFIFRRIKRYIADMEVTKVGFTLYLLII